MNVEKLEQIQLEYQWYLQHEKRLTYETCQLYKTIAEQFIKYVTNNSTYVFKSDSHLAVIPRLNRDAWYILTLFKF